MSRADRIVSSVLGTALAVALALIAYVNLIII